MDTVKGKLPSTYDFQISYLTKRGSSKRCIEQEADLISMYAQFDHSDTVTTFCNGNQENETNTRKHQCTADNFVTSASDHEEVRQVGEQLSEKHGDLRDRKQYLLWARIYIDQWKNLYEEPDIPLLCGD